jgi:protein O-mannosyl-transferase
VMASRAVHFTWIAPVAAGIVLLLVRKRFRWAMVATILFLIPLAPVLGIVPFGFQVISTVTDHYLYLPMMGVAIGAAFALSYMKPYIAIPLGTAIVVALAARSWVQMQTWETTRTAFEHNLQINPKSWSAETNLASDALARGDGAYAEMHSRAALKLKPDDERVRCNLGFALIMQGRVDETLPLFREAMDRDRDYAPAHVGLGMVLYHHGQMNAARGEFGEALRLEPDLDDAREGLRRVAEYQKLQESEKKPSREE